MITVILQYLVWKLALYQIYKNYPVKFSSGLLITYIYMVRNHQDWYPYLNLHFFFENIHKRQFLINLIGQWIPDGDGRVIARDIKKKISFSKLNKKW